jgi:hypothetical protein
MMRIRTAAWVAAAMLLVGQAVAQVGHPAKGSWLGFWGPDSKQQHRVVLLLDWRDRALAGFFNPGPKQAPVTRAEIDYDTWTMTLEALVPATDGKPQRWVGTGKIENLGSWTNRRWSGTYTHGNERGSFKVTLQ